MAIKYGSRKFIILTLCIVVNIVMPIAYQLLKIEGTVTIAALGLVNGLSGLYFGANLIDKKMGSE